MIHEPDGMALDAMKLQENGVLIPYTRVALQRIWCPSETPLLDS